MSRIRISSLMLLAALGLSGCDGGVASTTEVKHVELTDEQKAEIEKNDRLVNDEEQGQKLTQPRKGGKSKRG